MLSKEEIEKAKECLQETIQNTYAEGKAIKLNNVLKYIDQLESDKQKLIEKLEKRRNQNNNRYCQSIDNDEFPEMYEYGAYVEEDNYILSILKGE